MQAASVQKKILTQSVKIDIASAQVFKSGIASKWWLVVWWKNDHQALEQETQHIMSQIRAKGVHYLLQQARESPNKADFSRSR